ncbi:uncharacterized protein METZ01_LOCUS233323 [marine metagenome]|uniref:Amidohydrolase-related domain-containing protein n=1 Tax=marine metagenome TaxID=408172 RepID=A0A382GZU4_9ZZZZ
MIIDCHAHVTAPPQLWAYKATLLAHRGAHGKGRLKITDDDIRTALHTPEIAHLGHLPLLEELGTSRQLVSPRPFQTMHSERPTKLVHWFIEACNNVIHRQCEMYPETFLGVAGLPQCAGEPIEDALPELERCVNELGFVGCLLNPDPYENSGQEAPPLGDKYWYPLYEKLCELDVPASIHSTGSRSERVAYSLHFINEESIAVGGLLNSKVFNDFPDLKIIVPHGGGAVPYQIGRFQSSSLRRGGPSFTEKIRRLYFDTVLYSEGALRLLFETVGADRCLFGAEAPGVGSPINPETGRCMDDIAPIIQGFDWLSDEEKQMIFSGNTIKLFKLNIE